MNTIERLKEWELSAWRWMRRHRVELSRMSLGLVFVWFGVLKPLGLSPANELVIDTLPWGMDPDWVIPILGWWEVAIGICFIDPLRYVFGRESGLTRLGLILLALQMPATFLPLIVLPERVFTVFPYGLTLEGQYIFKNLVLISAALVVGGSSRMRERAPADASATRGRRQRGADADDTADTRPPRRRVRRHVTVSGSHSSMTSVH